MEDEVSLADYWKVVWEHRGMVVSMPVVAALASVAYTWCFIPRTYRATTTLLMPQPMGGASSALQQLSANIPAGLSGLAPGLPGLPGGALDTYKAILESATVRAEVAAELGLGELFGLSSRNDILRALSDMVQVQTDPKANLLKVSVSVPGTPGSPLRHQHSKWGRNDIRARVLSARMASSYVQDLNEFVERSVLFNAKQNRVFVQAQKAKAESELRKAEEALATFQERKRTISLPDEVQAMLKNQSSLEAEKVAADVAFKQASAQIGERARQAKVTTEAARADRLPEITPALQRWIKQLRDTELDLAIREHQFAEAHPEVKKLKLEVEGIKRRLRDEVARLQRAADLGIAPDLTDLEVARIAAE